MDSARDSTEIIVADPRVETGGEDILIIFSFSSTALLSPSGPGRVSLVEPLYEVVREDVVVVLSLHQQGASSQ